MSDFFIPADFDFGQQFDRTTLQRAMALDPERAMLSMQVDGPTLVTRMQGSGAVAYQQRIELPVDRRLGLRVQGSCSCPMGTNCKHVAGALMAFEAYQIRLEKNRLAGEEDPRVVVTPVIKKTSPASPSAPQLPKALQQWLAEMADLKLPAAAESRRPVLGPEDAADADAKLATRQLMYLLNPQGTQLELRIHLGSLRRTGELGSHHAHTPSVADMLRNPAGYLQEADLVVLAALLPLAMQALTLPLVLSGKHATTALRAILASGRSWLLPGAQDKLTLPPGPPARWTDAPRTVSLHWAADSAGQWRTHWQGEAGQPLALVLLPQPHVLDVAAATLQPATLTDAALPGDVADWMTRMPPVPAQVLPLFIEKLQRDSASRQLSLPLPHTAQADGGGELGALPLVPVLRLSTCVDVSSEAMLHYRYGSAASRSTTQRQPSAQLLLRYVPPGLPPVDFHVPASGAQGAFVELPGADLAPAEQPLLARFERDGLAEGAALRELFSALEFRPWSLAAGLATNRLTKVNSGRMQDAAIPPASEGQPLVWVQQRRERWPELLAVDLPALQAQGWLLEVEADFPYELHQADEWAVSIDEIDGDDDNVRNDWFRVGLKVSVDGKPVDLVPLLVGLVHSGWLKLDTALRQRDERDGGGGHVMVPWPSDEAAAPGQPPRQRLLRLPVQRVAPLMDWLRAVFKAGDKGAPPLELSRFDLGTLEALSADAVVTAPPSFNALVEQLRALQSGQGLPPVAPSPSVNAVLRHYQLDGLAWMDFMRRAHLGGVLADDMGLGKTLQALALLQGELDAGRCDRPSLVIVPTSLLGNWAEEARRFTPNLKVLVLHGPRRNQQFKKIAQAHLVITSYPLAVRDSTTLAGTEWHYLVLDEAQRIKNSRSQAATSLKGLRARHRLCLSGTPLENHLGELWSLFDFVCPGLLGSEAQFREHCRNPIEKRHDTLQAEHLARRVRPFILRRTKSQVAKELPEKTETLLRVELSGAQADLYETVRATMDDKLREAISRQGLARSQIMVLDALLKLRQVCCDPRLLKMARPTEEDAAATAGTAPAPAPASGRHAPSAKMELLLDLLPTLIEDGRRVLLFSQFTEMLALIEPELTKLKLPYLKLTGETENRSALVARFQQGETPLFLISLKAGGVGLNLTAADTVILYDPWWNPAVEQQAIDRAYRIGQDKPVFVYKLLASGTVEDKMVELQARKAGLADLLLSGVASDAALNAQDFDELFKPLGAH